jgi:hypothetical protein
MNVKLGKNQRIKNEHLKVKISTLNRYECKSLYINIFGKIEPLNELENYKTHLNKLNIKIKKYLHKNINSNIINKNTFIIDHNFKSEKLKIGKKTSFYYEITLYYNNPSEFNSKTINELSILVNKILKKYFINNSNFIFSKK